MPHVFEPAASGRSKCRGCGRALQRGELRFGERLPNPFAEGAELTLWFHPMCAAYKRAEAILQALPLASGVPDAALLQAIAEAGVAQPKLARIDGVERAKGVATCRHCREPIARGAWRIRMTLFDEGMFNPLGFVHLECGRAYCESEAILERLLHFSPALDDAAREELGAKTG
jgi:hypothetical protein